MLPQNTSEYKLLREELQKVKDCITTYMGFMLGGAGLAFVQMGASTTGGDALGAVIAMCLAVVVSLMLRILFYKFNSHNRFSGYCKLLTQEVLAIAPGTHDIILWESAMDKLRECEIQSGSYMQYCGSMVVMQAQTNTPLSVSAKVGAMVGPSPALDAHSTWDDFALVWQHGLQGKSRSSSWGFPAYVTLVFMVVTLIFLGFAAMSFHQSLVGGGMRLSSTAAICCLASCLGVLWLRILKRFWSLMMGSRAVDAYCWKFVPIRHMLLSQRFPNLIYTLYA